MKRVLVIVGVGLALVGCSSGPPDAGDPRKGRTTITWSNCVTGACVYDWKVCVGPDLHLHIDGLKGRDDRVLEDSPECQEDK